ncbi:G-protein coupled receptor 26 isoform X2 [Onychostoma macrolepis]|uniref:G-protein coupled receptor 26 isoform X2 n=1 Tax=Onychostoma macrolepis TaxID=369639 RepID=UPI00272BCF0F|nr:G-protein coupled receptor 26 isoform X2 [Onychostoma macrolepis]
MNLLDIFLELLIVVIAVVSLVANSLVLLCFTCSAQVRAQVPAIFITNLSFCNILIAVLNMPSTLLGVVKQQKPFGDHFCYTVCFMDTFLTTNTMLSMAVLSIDRWIAVVFPLTYPSKMRLKNAALMVSYAWLHSLAFSLTPLLLSWVDYSPAYASCTVHLREDAESRGHFMVFTAVFHACTFALSLFILCFAYLKVLQVARFHCKRIDVITVQTLLLLVDIHPSVKQRCLLEQKKRRQRATKKICIFIGSFVLCFAPYVITRCFFVCSALSSLGHRTKETGASCHIFYSCEYFSEWIYLKTYICIFTYLKSLDTIKLLNIVNKKYTLLQEGPII